MDGRQFWCMTRLVQMYWHGHLDNKNNRKYNVSKQRELNFLHACMLQNLYHVKKCCFWNMLSWLTSLLTNFDFYKESDVDEVYKLFWCRHECIVLVHLKGIFHDKKILFRRYLWQNGHDTPRLWTISEHDYLWQWRQKQLFR